MSYYASGGLRGWRARWADRPRGDERSARFLTRGSARWVRDNRAWSWWYLQRYARFAAFRLRNPHVVCRGLVFLGRDVELYARPGHGRMVLGRFVHLGDGNSLRCHEGRLVVGDKVVFGKDNTVNAYLDVEIGASTLVADWCYLVDFDHVTADVHTPIKDQGIVKRPVRVGPDVWLGVKSSVLSGVEVGQGAAVAAHAVVREDVPGYAVVGGVPARVLADRLERYAADASTRAAVADMARKQREALETRLFSSTDVEGTDVGHDDRPVGAAPSPP